MQFSEQDTERLRQYLLGDLDEENQIEIESRLLLERENNDLLLIVEEDLIDDFVRDVLTSEERSKFVSHLLPLPGMKQKVLILEAIRRLTRPTQRSRQNEPSKERSGVLLGLFRRLNWRVVTGLAVLTLLIGGVCYWGLREAPDYQTGMAQLNQAYLLERPLESRITGMNYAPYPVTRGVQSSPLSGARKIALDRAGRIFLDLVSEKPSPQTYHAAGRYYLAQSEFAQAENQFNEALKAEIAKPRPDLQAKLQIYTDLAVALFEKAKTQKKQDPVKYELGMADARQYLYEALKLDDQSAEALFNLGLYFREKRLWNQAIEAWDKYLARDPFSAWSEEAKKHREIAAQEAGKQVSLTPESLLQSFLNAYHANDRAKAWEILSQNRELINESLVWFQIIGAYLNSGQNPSPTGDDLLLALEFAGELEFEKGDRFTRELAAFYRSSSLAQKGTLIQARERLRQGFSFLRENQYPQANEEYRAAKAFYLQAGDPWEACVSDLMVGYIESKSGKAKNSVQMLQSLVDLCERKQYLAILVQALCSLGAVYFGESEYSLSNRITARAAETARRIDDAYGLQKSQAQLAYHYKHLDDFDQSLSNLHGCMEASSDVWPGDRQMWRSYDTMAQVHFALRNYAAALDYQRETLLLGDKISSDSSFRSVSYSEMASILGKLQFYDQAVEMAQKGLATDNTAIAAYGLLQSGHLYREAGNFKQAEMIYDQSIERFSALGDQVMIYSAHKGRLLCYLAQGNDAAASDELQVVLNLAEKYRSRILEEKHRNSFFDAEQNVYDLAIDFEASRRGDRTKAFHYSEMSRARSLLDLINAGSRPSDKMAADPVGGAKPYSLDLIRRNLPPDTQIVQYSVLDDKILIWVISQTSFDLVERKISFIELRKRVDRYLEYLSRQSNTAEIEAEGRRQAIELYDILIAPLEAGKLLNRGDSICIAPDKFLSLLPFNALISTKTGRYLINDYRMQIAPSSTIYLRCTEFAARRGGEKEESAMVLGKPDFDQSASALGDLEASEREAKSVASYYRDSTLFLGANASEARVKSLLNRVDVLHLASHYVVDDSAQHRSKLLLAKETELREKYDGALDAEEVYQKRPLRARLAVLSACRSGVEHYYNGEGMIGLARAFIASGVPLAVASLWPVDSDPTADLMIKFHQYRKQNHLPTVEALRQAQLEMINGSSIERRHPNYWASFLVIGGDAAF
jgi:CHAT domain-containing protein